MRHALSSTQNRQIKIIELLRTTNSYVSVKKIAKIVDAVPKTIVNDCQEIEERWNAILQIERNTSGDLHLSEKHNYTVREVFSDILKESPTFQLLEILFFQPGKLRTELEKELFLSSSSLYRRIVKLNEGLKMRGLQIDRNNLMLTGTNELQVRLFMAAYFLEVYDVYEWPFQLDQKVVWTTVNQIDRHFDLKLNFLQRAELSFLIAVSIIRQQQGFLNSDKRDLSSEKTLLYETLITELLSSFSLPITELVKKDSIQTIFWYDFSWDNLAEEERIERFSDNIIDLIVNALGITISNESRKNCISLFKTVYNSYKTYPYETYIAYNRQLYNSLTIQRDFAVFSKVLEKILKDQESKNRFPWYTMYYHQVLFELFIYWEDLPKQLDQLRRPVLTEVCSDLGPKHAQLLAYYLNKNFHDKLLLDVQSEKIYAEVASDSLISDLYVTNFSTPIIPEERLFVLEDVPSIKSLAALGRKIDDFRMNTLIKQLDYLNE